MKKSYIIILTLLILNSFYVECTETKKGDAEIAESKEVKIRFCTISIYTGSNHEREKIKEALKAICAVEPTSFTADNPKSSYKFFKLTYFICYESADKAYKLFKEHLEKLDIDCSMSIDKQES